MARMLQNYPEIAVHPEQIEGMLDFRILFGRDAPLHVEVGSGKGTFLLAEAQAHPEINYFGVEWAGKYYRHAVDRLGRWGVSNVRLIRTDVAFLLSEHVPDASIDCMHVYYPDPWPKARHHKRRFVNEINMQQILRCLKPGGRLQLATDHEDYFLQMQSVLSAELQKGTIEMAEFLRPAGAQEGEIVGTNYERKYIKEGRNVHALAALKR